MLSRTTLTTSKAAAATGLLLIFFTGCRHTAPQATFAPATSPPTNEPPKVKYSETYDPEIQEIMDLANKDRWEEAQTKADALFQKAPQNPAVQRIHGWVIEAGQKQRAQALENKIREIDAKHSVFNPTIPQLLKEHKDRGLLSGKDVRDTLDRIENSPNIPDTYDKKIHKREPVFDLESTKGQMAKILENEVSIHVDNVPLETILDNVSEATGVNIVADKSLPALKQLLLVHVGGKTNLNNVT